MSTVALTTYSSSAAQTITCGSTADTFPGTYTQVIASTSADADGLLVQLRCSSTDRNTVLQFYTGGSGSEVAFGPEIFFRGPNASIQIPFWIPGTIASGTRISVRGRDSVGSAQILVGVQAQKQDSLRPLTISASKCFPTTTSGSSSASVAVVDAGASANTFVSQTTNLSSSTPAAYNMWFVEVNVNVSANVDFLWRINANSTTIIDATYVRGANGTPQGLLFGPFFADVASGSTLGAEISCSGTTVGSRELRITAYGYNATTGGGSSIISGDDMVNLETFARGAAGKIVTVLIKDTSGNPKTGLAYNTGSFTCHKKVGTGSGAAAAVTLADMTLGTYTANGFKEIDATNLKGYYQYCPATLDASADQETHLFAKSGTILDTPFVIKLTAGDPRAATVDANVTQVSGDSTAADNLEAMLDGTGGVTLSAVLGSNAITDTSIASDAITAAKIADGAIDSGAIASDAITAAKIATGAIDADALATDAVAEIVAGVFARAFDATKMSGLTFEQIIGLCATALLGKASGLAGSTATFRNLGDTADAVVATVDADGNRTAVTRTASAVA